MFGAAARGRARPLGEPKRHPISLATKNAKTHKSEGSGHGPSFGPAFRRFTEGNKGNEGWGPREPIARKPRPAE
jgi:hypothetical protein